MTTRGRRKLLRRTYRRTVANPPSGARLEALSLPLPGVAELPPRLTDAAERIREEAESVLRHEVDFLGSGPVELGPEIDWHSDFKSGHRWERAFYQDVVATRLTDTSDAKIVWELNRGHHLLTLARAARLFEDERFAAELESQLRGWLAANPPGVGINWVNPMEIGFRATNWVWSVSTLEQWKPLEPELRREVTRSLQSHARHIRANLEGSPYLRSNHYLGDLMGLLVLGTVLRGDPSARGWLAFARSQFEKEILKQTHEDGVSFEASLPYHGLVLEMFLVAKVVAGLAGQPLSPTYDERLWRMLEVSRAVRHPDGRIPQFGDGDSGRVLPAGFDRSPTHDHLLWLGSAVFGTERLLDGDASDEVAWTLGAEAWVEAGNLPPAPVPGAAFPQGGLYALRGGPAHAVVRCGDVGQNGNGGHAHNDALSYELSYGHPVVVDSGTYVYTGDVAARNAFRSTSAHNTVQIDSVEINPIEPNAVFALRQVARTRAELWEEEDERVCLVAIHDGYRRLEGGVVHRRELQLDRRTGELAITDRLEGSGDHEVESFVHLSPQAKVGLGDEGYELVVDGGRVGLSFWGPPGSLELTEAWVSPGYGVRERAPLLVFRASVQLPTRLGCRFVPQRAGRSTSGGERAERIRA